MNTCCGEEVKTRFCPHCGKEVNKEPILELLAHIKKSMGEKVSRAKQTRRWADEGRNGESWDSRIANRDALAKKWTDWHNALVTLIQEKK